MSQEDKRISFVEAKKKSKEELIQYLMGIYSYCTNYNYIDFVKFLVGEDYQQGDIWLVGQIQKYDKTWWVTIGNIWHNELEKLNPFKYEEEKNDEETVRAKGLLSPNRKLYTWNSQKYCPYIDVKKEELEEKNVIIAKIEIDDEINDEKVLSLNQMCGLLKVSDYRIIAKDCFVRDSEGKIRKYFEIKSYSFLVSGSPGAGKSNFVDNHFLSEICGTGEAKENRYERFVINDSVTYEDLVGSYKPVRNGDIIKYEFVPGPFIKLYEKARSSEKIRENNSSNKTAIGLFCGLFSECYVLILEELSRGDAYNILGDLYLLLERDEDGESKHSVSIDHYLSEYLTKSLREPVQSIKLPSNFYVIATMNNADSGVSYMDASIRRRFTPIFIDHEGNRFGDKYTNIEQISTNELLNFERIKKEDAIDLIDKINAKLVPDKRIAPAIIDKPIYKYGISIVDFFNLTVGYLTQYVYRNDGEHHSFTWYLENDTDSMSLMKELKNNNRAPKDVLNVLFKEWGLI